MIMTSGHILALLVGFFDVIIVIILLLSYRTNKHVNVYLIIILISVATKMLHTGFTTDESDIFAQQGFLWVRPIMLLGIAATYLYIKSLVKDEKRLKPQALYHSIVPVLWSLQFFVPSLHDSIPEDIWLSVRKLFITSYVFFYIALTLVFLKDYFKKDNPKQANAKHFKSIKNWVGIFFIFSVLIMLRALAHFCFNFENNGGLLSEASFMIKIGLLFFVLLKIVTSPELLFGYPKIHKSLSLDSESDSEMDTENVILKINNEYYLKDKPIEDYFEGKTLECITLLLNNHGDFVNLNSLDDLFISEYKASFATVKKRREQSIKEMKFLLSFRLDVPFDDVFIESRDDIDKRIKLIKINPELLKVS